jgi:hypothetical protein
MPKQKLTEARKEQLRKGREKWALNNPEKKREASRKWSRNNRSKQVAADKARKARDPEKYKARVAAKWARYAAIRREQLNAKARLNYAKHRDERLATANLPVNRARRLEHARRFRKEKPEEYRAQRRGREARWLKNPKNKIIKSLRDRLKAFILQGRAVKFMRSANLCGCELDFLRGYIEAKFLPGMTWENHGKWHLDHIRPCATFDLLNVDEQRACFHYSNLQPLWALDNIRKGASFGFPKKAN